MAQEYTAIDYDAVITETESAILFCIEMGSLPDGPEWTVWISKSQIENHDFKNRCFSIPEWLAKEKELS